MPLPKNGDWEVRPGGSREYILTQIGESGEGATKITHPSKEAALRDACSRRQDGQTVWVYAVNANDSSIVAPYLCP